MNLIIKVLKLYGDDIIIWIFDLDGTICDTEYIRDNGRWEYKSAKPKYDVIEKINTLYDMGEYIVIFTARGTLSRKDYRELTDKQLKKWKVKYHEIRFDKPGGEIYVDDRTITPNDFVNRFSFYLGISAK